MQSRIGQAVLAVVIIGGAGAMVYSITRGNPEADEQAATPNKTSVPPQPSITLIPAVSRDQLQAAIAVLCDPIEIEALEQECDELVEELKPNETLTAPDGIPTLQDRRRESLAMRNMVREYREHSKDPPAIREEALELISQLERRKMLIDPKRDVSDKVARLNELYEAGSKNPVIRWHALWYGTSLDDVVAFVRALPDIEASNRFKLDVSGQYLRKYPGDMGNTPKMFQDYVKWLGNELSSFDAETGDIRAVFGSYLNEHLLMMKVFREWTLVEWAKDKPDIHPVFLYYLAGDAAQAMAWTLRGSGFADTVDEEMWQYFHEDMGVARQYFLKAWSLSPEFPFGPARLIATARTAPGTKRSSREWFDITTTIQFDFGPAYSSYVPSLQPRWGGSDSQMFAFVRECFETDAPRTAVPWHGMDQLKWWLGKEEAVDRNFLRYSLETTDLLNFVIERLVTWDQQYGQDKTLVLKEIREWAVSSLLLNRMFLEAAPLTRNFREAVSLDAISKTGDPQFCLLATRALESENASELDDLEQRFVEPFAEFSLSELETWQEEVRKQAGSVQAPYLQTREEYIRVQALLALGKEVQLHCDAPARCWKFDRCELSGDQDHFLVKPFRTRARWTLASRISVRPPYTLRASLERVNEPDGGVSVLLARRPYDPATLPAVGRKFVRDAIFDLPNGKNLEVEVRITDESVSCFVNGEPVSGEVDGVSDSLCVWFESQETLRISDIRVSRDTADAGSEE